MNRELAATPPMGWNSWNMFGPAVDEEKIMRTADTLVKKGMKELGYTYVVIDDCWTIKDGRDPQGNLVPDPGRFPSGIKALADYVHSKGLKLGIYSDAADRTCAGYPGSYGHEEQDAALWASWGIDFLKYDYCNAPWDQKSAIERYRRMGNALASCGRDILFSLCEWGARSPHLWGKTVGGSMWRSSGDIFDSWVDIWVQPPGGIGYYGVGIDTNIELAARIAGYGGPGGWNDLDMLVVGLKGKGQIEGNGLSPFEYRTHMSVWSITCSPLFIGCDITAMDADTEAILTNPHVIAVNQDPLGVPGKRILSKNGCDVFRKPLHDGSTAMAVVNRGSAPAECSFSAGELGFLDTEKTVFDIWQGANTHEFTGDLRVKIEAHETKFWLIP
ncbi:MAG: glycoside hydrolase family 27 protein [Spirochaetales bacterium]|nr:glycoside hydrolase family 27 protein [Spirochaetales bacterium]